jgi:hypothetical protein
MAVNAAHVSVAANGDIRWTGPETGTYYTVLELHRFLGDLADDEQASGDDLVDITTDTPSERSTDQIISLNGTFNIDDTMARYLYDGSVSQDSGKTLYSGLRVLGTVEAGTELMIVQDDKVLPAWWGTGVNADAANNVITRQLVKSREGGADIDGKRILVLARELGDQYREFSVTLGLANSVAAISTANDLNNGTADATIEAWTTIVFTEGLRLIDIDNDTVNEEYYGEFDKGSQTLNDTYEWAKQVSQRAHVVLSGTDTATNYVIDDATIVGQSQSFTSRAVAEKLREARFRIKIGAGAPSGDLTAELYASAAGVIPTGAVLATSEPVLSSLITSNYREVIFRFEDNVTLTASTQYTIVIRHPNGGAADYFHVEGAASGTVAGENKAEENPAATWTAQAGADLWFSVKASPILFARPGELHRGPTHGPVAYDGEAGAGFSEDEIIFWGTQVTYDTLVGGPFTVGEYVIFENGATLVNGGKVLKDSGTVLWVALEDISGATLADGYTITGLDSGATAAINVTITDQDKAGGEAVLLALDDDGATGNLYIQLISGSAPVDNLPIEGRTSATTALVNVTVTGRPISPEFIGQSTGSNLIGAYGIGFQTTDVGASDLFFDLTNTQRQPPNNVTFTVTGLVSGEDRVLVGPRTGSLLEKGQWLLSTALTGATETAIVIKTGAEAAPIAGDTPGTGTGTDNTRLRVQLDSGIYRRQAYTSYTASTFTIASTDYSGANQAAVDNDVFVAYIDVLADAATEAFTGVYQSDRDLLARIRDGGGTPIKTNEISAVFGSTSSSVAATRTPDA